MRAKCPWTTKSTAGRKSDVQYDDVRRDGRIVESLTVDEPSYGLSISMQLELFNMAGHAATDESTVLRPKTKGTQDPYGGMKEKETRTIADKLIDESPQYKVDDECNRHL